jgi:hypothetical protein
MSPTLSFALEIRREFTKVPCLLPRSSSVTVPLLRETVAWRRETVGSKRGMWACSVRPIN